MSTIPCLASVNYHQKYYPTYFISPFRELKLNPKKCMWRETTEMIQQQWLPKHLRDWLPGLLPHIPMPSSQQQTPREASHPLYPRVLILRLLWISQALTQFPTHTLHTGTPTVPLSSQCLHPLALIEWNITWDSPHHFSAMVTFSLLAYIQVEEVGFVTSSLPMSPPNLISPPHLFIILFSIKHAIQLLHPFLLISNWNRTLPSPLTVPGMTNWKI